MAFAIREEVEESSEPDTVKDSLISVVEVDIGSDQIESNEDLLPGFYIADKIKGIGRSESNAVVYKISWRNFPNADTWEPLEHLEYCLSYIFEFNIKLKEYFCRQKKFAFLTEIETSWWVSFLPTRMEEVMLAKKTPTVSTSSKKTKTQCQACEKMFVNMERHQGKCGKASLELPPSSSSASLDDREQATTSYAKKRPKKTSSSKTLPAISESESTNLTVANANDIEKTFRDQGYSTEAIGQSLSIAKNNPDIAGDILRTFHKPTVHPTEPSAKFKCDHCEKSFSRKAHLSRHTKSIHLGTKEVCKICKKIFAHKDSLSSHVAKGCPTKKTFDCEKCEKSFRMDYKNVHMKLVHPEESE